MLISYCHRIHSLHSGTAWQQSGLEADRPRLASGGGGGARPPDMERGAGRGGRRGDVVLQAGQADIPRILSEVRASPLCSADGWVPVKM